MNTCTCRCRLLHRSLLVLLGLSHLTLVWAQGALPLEGTIRDAAGNAVEYATVTADEGAYGTLSRADGSYLLRLPPGEHQIRVRRLGFQELRRTIDLQRSQTLDLVLEAQALTLPEVTISSDGRDPAYGIIEAAIRRKKQNEIPFPAYQYQAYTKGSVELVNDSALLAFLVEMFGDEEDSLTQEELDEPNDLLYLSENLSRVYLVRPDDVKEEIIYSRVSGSSDQFGFMTSLTNRFNPYQDRFFEGGIAPRGLVSPISNQALFFYDYKLLGTVQLAGQKVYKIKVMPKRKSDPVYRGTLFIADSTYAVAELDLLATREQALQVLDTLRLVQEYLPLDARWVPSSSRLDFTLDLPLFVTKIPFRGSSYSIISDYQSGVEISGRELKREVLRVAPEALGHSPALWDSIRPVPLTQIERTDFRVKDSIERVESSPAYLDSLTRTRNKFNFPEDLLYGYTYRNYQTEMSWSFLGLLGLTGFNPMEGFYLGSGLGYRKGPWELEGLLRYGFSNQRLSYELSAEYEGNAFHAESMSLKLGDYPREFSDFTQISPWVNSLYALWGKQNFRKLYQPRFAELRYSRELFNGFTLEPVLRVEQRRPLEVSTDYSFRERDTAYPANLLLDPHSMATLDLGLRLQPFNRYIRTPTEKINNGSAWPLLRLHYRLGQRLDAADGEEATYHRFQLGLEDEQSLGLLGTLLWQVEAGRFLNDASEQAARFPDVFHFKGNETILRGRGFDQFMLMPYYVLSGTQTYVQAHVEQQFGGFFFNKIPGLRKLKMTEYVGLHGLWQEGMDRPYLELNAGVTFRLFRLLPLQLEFNTQLDYQGLGQQWGFKIVTNLSDLESLGL